jgi:hypothetical protein
MQPNRTDIGVLGVDPCPRENPIKDLADRA